VKERISHNRTEKVLSSTGTSLIVWGTCKWQRESPGQKVVYLEIILKMQSMRWRGWKKETKEKCKEARKRCGKVTNISKCEWIV